MFSIRFSTILMVIALFPILLYSQESEVIRCSGSDWQSCIDDASCNDAIIMSDNNVSGSILDINKNITLIAGGFCEEGKVPDCDGTDNCCLETWIGDGYGDCEDQYYGCDLTCYDNDGADCSNRTDSDEFNEMKLEEALPNSRGRASRKLGRSSEIDFPDVRDDHCDASIHLININFDADADNHNSALYLKSSDSKVLDKLVINNCEFDGDDVTNSYGIRHSSTSLYNNGDWITFHTGKVSSFSIFNSTIKNTTTGLKVEYSGNNFSHTIGNSLENGFDGNSNGVEFINNSTHLDYSNFNGGIDAKYNYLEGLGSSLTPNPDNIVKLNWDGQGPYMSELQDMGAEGYLASPIFQDNFGPWYTVDFGTTLMDEVPGMISQFPINGGASCITVYNLNCDIVLGWEDGCMDSAACNYNSAATSDDGSCTYIASGACDCNGSQDLGCGCGQAGPSGCDNACGSTLVDDDCGVCDGNNSSCTGCTDPLAENYNGNYTIGDESCTYASTDYLSLYVDGTNNSIVTIPADSSNLNLTTNGGIFLWMKPDGLAQDKYAGLIAKTDNYDSGGNTNGQSYTIVWRQEDRQLIASISDGANKNSVSYDLDGMTA